MMNVAIPRDDAVVAEQLRTAPTPLALLRQTAAARPEHPAVVYLRSGNDPAPVVITYAQLLAEVEQAARAFHAAGVKETDSITILLPMVPQAISSLIAAMSVGVAFPMNLLLSAAAMAPQLALARTRMVVTMGPHPALDVRPRVDAALEQLPEKPKVVELPLGEPSPGAVTWADFLATGTDVELPIGEEGRGAALVHTGGSMGAPKLAELSQRNLAAGGLMAAAGFGWRADDRILTGLPLFHVGGAVDVVMSAIAAGATVMFPTALGLRNPEVIARFWSIVDESQATIVGSVPTGLAAIASSPRGDSRLTTLRAFVTGGSPLPGELARRLEKISGKPIYQLYGMTETAGITTSQFIDGEFHAPCGGRPVPLARVSIGAPDQPLQPKQRGEIFVSGPNVFKGYRTSTGIDSAPVDGWVASGDLGEVTATGEIQLVGRTKDVIIRSGHNIDPLLIEEVAVTHPAVAQAAAIGMPDAYAGELPVLYVALAPGATATTEEIIEYVGQRIAEPPARPKQAFILAEMPLTPIGKVARYRLRQMAAEHRARTALEDNPAVAKLECADPAAKRIMVQWTVGSMATQRQQAVQAVAELGLELVEETA